MAPEAALGRVLAAPVTAAVSLPPWDNSAMDGFAIRAADVACATEDAPVRLTVVGEVAGRWRAGRPGHGRDGDPHRDRGAAAAGRRRRGAGRGHDAARRARAAPGRADARCWARCRPRRWSTPRVTRGQRDPDARQRRPADDVLARPGDLVTPAVVALASGAGVATVAVRRRADRRGPRDGRRGARPGHGRSGPAGIPDANGPGLRALVREAGGGAAGPRDRGRHARGRRGAAPARPRRGGPRRRVAAACRSARTTSSGSRSTTWVT